MIPTQKFCPTTALQNLRDPVPYIPENFKGLFLSQPKALGILTCGYFFTSLRDHPLHCWGYSYTEGSEKVGMHPTRLGLVETGVGYTETVSMIGGARRNSAQLSGCTLTCSCSQVIKQLQWIPGVVYTSFHSGFDRCKGMTLFDD